MSRAVTAARGVLTALAFTSAALVLSVLPGVGELPERSRLDHRSTEVVDRHGRPLSESLSARDTRNRPVALSDVSPHIASALLAVEDRRFYAHGGIDPLATARAAWSNLVELRVVSGGSTLTQQLARLLSADAAVAAGRPVPERTAVQKLREAHLALRLEQSFDKHEILELFLNRAPFGHSAVGVEAAARRYFDTSARTLSVEQSAWLIALIRGPSFYDPFEHRVRLERRMRSVLSAMHTKGFLTDSQVERAKATPVIPHRYAIPGESIHARGLARREWRAKGGGALPERLALTVDARLEERIRAIVRDEAPKIYRRGARSSAVVVLDHHQGEVLAAVGSTFEENPHWGEFSAVTALRQPGSALKPFLYAAALERGETAASLAADIEKPFPDTWGIYKPKNYDELYHGPVRYRAALAQSLNVAAVDVLADVGLEGFFSTL
ncbi:MAG: transglycosylase domain-containing protein, partial [Myxococcota bacterium]